MKLFFSPSNATVFGGPGQCKVFIKFWDHFINDLSVSRLLVDGHQRRVSHSATPCSSSGGLKIFKCLIWCLKSLVREDRWNDWDLCSLCDSEGKCESLTDYFAQTDAGKILFKFNFSYFGTRLANVKSPISQN